LVQIKQLNFTTECYFVILSIVIRNYRGRYSLNIIDYTLMRNAVHEIARKDEWAKITVVYLDLCNAKKTNIRLIIRVDEKKIAVIVIFS